LWQIAIEQGSTPWRRRRARAGSFYPVGWSEAARKDWEDEEEAVETTRGENVYVEWRWRRAREERAMQRIRIT